MRYPHLNSILKEEKGLLRIVGKHLIPDAPLKISKPKILRNYQIDESIDEYVINNKQWAETGIGKPKFFMAYLMLPTECNQKCFGCFTGAKRERRLPAELDGNFFSYEKIDEIIKFGKEHGLKSIVYGGAGELFSWKGAFEYIEHITKAGLAMTIFTNGTLLKPEQIDWLSERDISLVFSLKDTREEEHDRLVGRKGSFRQWLASLDRAVSRDMADEGKLCIQMATMKQNEDGAVYDLIPACRHLGIVPLLEVYLLNNIPEEKLNEMHTFKEARSFYEKIYSVEKMFGVDFPLCNGQKLSSQPPCKRWGYAFSVFPSGDVKLCFSPTQGLNKSVGNIYKQSLKNIFYSETFRKQMLFKSCIGYCPDSVFYTKKDADIPGTIPDALKKMI